MKFLRNLIDDLWEKRLWPIPLVLVAALVAVPLLLTKSGPSDTAGVGAPATPKIGPLASSQPAVDIAQPDSAGRLVHLDKHNPFIQQHLPKAASTTTAKTTSSAGKTSGGGGAGGGAAGAGANPGNTGGAGSQSTTPVAPKTFDVVSLDIRFGNVERKRERHDLARLAPLPSSGNPVIIYLGLLEGTRTAVFLVNPDARADGDGSCSPSSKDCQTVRLRAGDTEFFDVTSASGRITEYELDLLHVKLTKTTDAKRATAASTRASKRGKTLLRRYLHSSGSQFIGDLRYDASLGRLVTVHSPASAWGKLGLGGSFAATPGSDSTTSPR